MRVTIRVATALAAVFAGSIAHAAERGHMASGDAVAAPTGYAEMCARAPARCRTASSADTRSAPIDADQMRLVRRINRQVNRRVVAQADVGERWQSALNEGGGIGDCEDFAIDKRNQLLRAGVRADQMFFATAYIPSVGLHAVLVVRTHKGDMVLDNRSDWVRLWSKTGYVWLARQSLNDPLTWFIVTQPRRA
ncbi:MULTISPECIES: transglutaminase-like cysteine peptidase [unclassified Sphingomonas]|uniref:transglutaminase-like cysteine peptidase n=1 Tax=unclassified Sphingomonas TaxID=196159 RepID=UPI00083325FB|nr:MULTISPECIES: transglutaminase-like cysteine peptidase [unclassified Sphingomonas]